MFLDYPSAEVDRVFGEEVKITIGSTVHVVRGVFTMNAKREQFEGDSYVVQEGPAVEIYGPSMSGLKIRAQQIVEFRNHAYQIHETEEVEDGNLKLYLSK